MVPLNYVFGLGQEPSVFSFCHYMFFNKSKRRERSLLIDYCKKIVFLDFISRLEVKVLEICKIKQNKNGVAKLFLFNTFVCIALFSFEEKRTENSNFTTKHKSTELPGFLERTTGIQVLRMTLEVQTTLLLAAGWQNVYKSHGYGFF